MSPPHQPPTHKLPQPSMLSKGFLLKLVNYSLFIFEIALALPPPPCRNELQCVLIFVTLMTVTYIRLKKLWISYAGTSSDSTDTPELSVEGFTGRVLLILSAVIQLLVWTIAFVVVAHRILGLFISCTDFTLSFVLEPENLNCILCCLWCTF